MIRAILTDIEGTTSSIHFVRDVLFPYADQAMGEFLATHSNKPEVKIQIEATRQLAKEPDATLNRVTAILRQWIKEDQKLTPLKALQGMIWRAGYTSGAFKAHIYNDAAIRLSQWHHDGLPLYVYSSGSIEAQKLFFAHTEVGDITPLFSNYFDTTIGGKRESASYREIAQQIGLSADSILFLSDIEAELDAAREAGMQTTWLVREGEPTTAARHPVARSFDEIDLVVIL